MSTLAGCRPRGSAEPRARARARGDYDQPLRERGPGRRHTLWPSMPNATAGSRKPSSASQRGVIDASDGVTVEVQPECVHVRTHPRMHARTCEQLRCDVHHAVAAQVQPGAASQQPPANTAVDMSEARRASPLRSEATAPRSGVAAHAGLTAALAPHGASRSARFDPVVPFASD